ncbi:sensor domain-containing diguanylate cyclase [Pseudothauera rhizosphaerae]|uniref:sensor domain-containing diguanylate cyclase n=1 Tax=Pseudothauera rhizosphaerae TaxID=2565932 RepID=UPI001454D131|nr:sensor domain-containing diguanylate cyclase [Pseudothauera rhizosphaerae]
MAAGFLAIAMVAATIVVVRYVGRLRRRAAALDAACAADPGFVFVFRRTSSGAPRCVYRNPAAKRLCSESFTADPLRFAAELVAAAFADGQAHSNESALDTAAGRRTVRWSACAVADAVRPIRRVTLRGRDRTEARDDEAQRQLATAVLAQTRDCVLVTDATGRIVLVNQAFCDTTGYRREEVIGHSPSLLASGLHERSFFRAMWEALEHEGAWQGEVWNRRKNGDLFAEALSITALRDETGRVSHYVGVSSDITAQKAQTEQLQHLAHYDPLTHLANRALFHDRLGHAVYRADRTQGRIGVMFLDLDGFKAVNDSAGHDAGDHLLQEVARRLVASVRKADTVSRLGGDEFTILVEPVLEVNQIVAAAERIIAAVNRPVTVGEETFHVGVSIGIAVYPDHATSVDGLLECADHAMYQAKQQGKNRYVLHASGAA